MKPKNLLYFFFFFYSLLFIQEFEFRSAVNVFVCVGMYVLVCKSLALQERGGQVREKEYTHILYVKIKYPLFPSLDGKQLVL